MKKSWKELCHQNCPYLVVCLCGHKTANLFQLVSKKRLTKITEVGSFDACFVMTGSPNYMKKFPAKTTK